MATMILLTITLMDVDGRVRYKHHDNGAVFEVIGCDRCRRYVICLEQLSGTYKVKNILFDLTTIRARN